MSVRALVSRLGPRLFLSYLLASLAAAVTGLAVALLAPAQTYEHLMYEVMNPPPGSTRAQMDAVLYSAVNSAVAFHVAISLGVAIAVSVLAAAFVSREMTASIGRVVDATRRLATGHLDERVVAGNVREVAELAENVNNLAKALEEAEGRRSLAIASIGHELRTPVMALRSYVDGIRDGLVKPTPDVVERMDLSVTRLERMAADLSALAHAEASDRQDVALSQVPVAGALRAAYDGFKDAFAAGGVQLRFELEGVTEDACVGADAVRLAEILENLLSNSLAHTPAGRHVTLGGEVGDETVEAYVTDEGDGIDPLDLPHVMEPFYRGQGGSRGRTPRPGMGLGLAIASRLAKAMGGSLVLTSAGRGLGSTARLHLPRAMS